MDANWRDLSFLASLSIGQPTADQVENAGNPTYQWYAAMKRNEIPIDIVPFGAIENEGSISWPPDDSVTMNVAGFNDAYHATQTVRLRESPVLDIQVVTPAALVILKLMAWKERSSEHSRDAIDLALILRCYLGCWRL